MSSSVILFLAANPVTGAGDARGAFDQECAAVEHELQMAPLRDRFVFRSKWAVTIDDVFRHILDVQPTVIHFSGHGGASGLMLVGDRGQPQAIAPVALAKMIRSTAERARLAVLSACYSQDQAEALRDAVGCAIGMAGTISEDDARTFATRFYYALGHGRPVGNAYEQAIAALAGKDLPGQMHPRCLARADVDVERLRLDQPPDPPQPRAAPRDPVAPDAPSPPSGPLPPQQPEGAVAGYDLFLAHPSASKPSARALYELLQPDVRAFLDERSLRPGDRWDQRIPAAQQASRATVILLSSHANAAWFLGDEIVTAIALHRASPAAHRLLPVKLEPGVSLPYGLSHIQAIDATAVGGLTGVASLLREQVVRMRGEPSPPQAPSTTPPGGGPVRGGNGCDHFLLHERLCRLSDVIFEQIVFHASIDRAVIAPRAAPLAERVLDVAQLAALDPQLCRRIAAELDRRAPWTR